MDLKGKRWAGISVFHDYSLPAPVNEPWSVNVERNLFRLLQAPSWSINNTANIPIQEFDIFVVPNFDIRDVDKQVDFIKRVKDAGKKVVVAYSQDSRFLTGAALICMETGTLYTAICEYADLIFAGLAENLHMFGRYEHKVFPFGYPFERLNYSRPYDQRAYDLLVATNGGTIDFGYSVELLLTLKDRFPSKRIVFSIDPALSHLYKRYSDKIEFIPGGLLTHLPLSKAFLDPQLRPRPNRSIHEAWMCRTPFISSSFCYYSKLFPGFNYSKMDMIDIGDKYELLQSLDYNLLIAEAEKIAEAEYFDNKYIELLKRLYPNQ